MPTDEPLIAEIRRELDRELSQIDPPAALAEAAWSQSRPVAARRRWRLGLSAGTAVLVSSAAIAAVVAVGAVVLLPGAGRPSPQLSGWPSPATRRRSARWWRSPASCGGRRRPLIATPRRSSNWTEEFSWDHQSSHWSG